MTRRSRTRRTAATVAVAALAPVFLYAASGTAAASTPARPGGAAGAVFVGTNHNNTTDPSQPANEVAYYQRAADGRLDLLGNFPTGGQGSGPGQRFAGDGLGSGNSVQVTENKRFLLVTNAGSNDVSVLRITPNH